MTRRKLPNRRPLETMGFESQGIEYTASIGRFRDGSISEIFLRCGKTGSAAEVGAHDLGVTVSLALQFGTPLSAIHHALQKFANGQSAGPMGALLDLIEAGPDVRNF